MSMRILHVLDHSIPLHSGYTFRTLSILREQRKLGWETFHITSPKQLSLADGVDEVEGWQFFRTQNLVATSLPGVGEITQMRVMQRRLNEVIEQLRPNIIHAHSPVLNALPALRAARSKGIPVVYEVRAFWEDAAVDHGTTSEGSVRYRLTRWLETQALRRVDHVFTICEGLRKDIVGRGIASSKVTVIPNAVDVNEFEPGGLPDENLRRQLGLQGAVVLGFAGSFYAYEGLDLLLRAMPAALAQRPDVRLLLVGGGPQEANLKAMVQQLGLSEQVKFTGRVPHDQVSLYYNQMDIMVYPRHSMRLTELVTPLKPLEAMALGKVMIASDVGGHKELIQQGETGFLFTAGNAEALAQTILQVIGMQAQWHQIRQQGRQFVENVRKWELSAQGYKSVYEKLCKGA